MTGEEQLESRLAKRRDAARERMPQYMELVDRMVAELKESIVGGAIGEGEVAPVFELRRAGSDEVVRLADVLQRGPAVLSFYRGQW